MKKSILGLLILILFANKSFAQNITTAEQEVIQLSKQKWEWMELSFQTMVAGN